MEIQPRRAAEPNEPYALSDFIQLAEPAFVADLVPPYATEDDVYEVLKNCGLTVGEIYNELDRCTAHLTKEEATVEAAEHLVMEILRGQFKFKIDRYTAHKAPL
jgi:hypothetical protein